LVLDDQFEDIRNQYDILNSSVYLMSAGCGPAGNYWLSAIKNYMECLHLGDMESVLRVHANRECFARHGNAKLIQADEDEVTNSYRVMAAANFVINNLVSWEKGDNVVFSDLTYPSISYILLNLKKMGVELRRVDNVNGEVLLSGYENVIDKNTKLVCVCRTAP